MLWKVPSWSILKIRFFKKYAGKFWRGRKEQARDTELFTITEKQKAQSKNVDIFVDLLSEGRIVEALASNLHFMDMFNLSSTCRAIREALGSSAKELEPYENLRVMSCDDGSKITCWTCKSQICCVSAVPPYAWLDRVQELTYQTGLSNPASECDQPH